MQDVSPSVDWDNIVSNRVNELFKCRKCVEPGCFSSSTTHHSVSCGLRDEATAEGEVSLGISLAQATEWSVAPSAVVVDATRLGELS